MQPPTSSCRRNLLLDLLGLPVQMHQPLDDQVVHGEAQCRVQEKGDNSRVQERLFVFENEHEVYSRMHGSNAHDVLDQVSILAL